MCLPPRMGSQLLVPPCPDTPSPTWPYLLCPCPGWQPGHGEVGRGCILPAPLASIKGVWRVGVGHVSPAVSLSRAWPWPSLPWAASTTVHLVDVLAGRIFNPPSLGTKSLLLWWYNLLELPVCHGLWWQAKGREDNFLPMLRAQCIGPVSDTGRAHSHGMRPWGTSKWLRSPWKYLQSREKDNR